jgi:hypothetical protein
MSILRFFGRKQHKRPSQSQHRDTTWEPQCDAPGLDYADPTIYKRVVDDQNHLYKHVIDHPTGEACNFRGNWNGPITAYKEQCSRYPRVKQLIDLACWGRFFKINTGRSSKRIVEALVERWWDTTHTFHLPCGELGFTPLDWTMLTGLPIGVGDPPPCIDDDYSFEVVKSHFFPEISVADWKSHGIRCSFLKTYFEPNILEASEGDDTIAEKIARAFFLLFLGEFLFPNASGLVGSGWLAALEDLNKVGKYDWSSPAMTLMYLSLDACSRQKQKTFNGPWQVLEVIFQCEIYCFTKLYFFTLSF